MNSWGCVGGQVCDLSVLYFFIARHYIAVAGQPWPGIASVSEGNRDSPTGPRASRQVCGRIDAGVSGGGRGERTNVTSILTLLI